MYLPPRVIDFIEQALREDLGSGDITTNMLIPPDHFSTARLVAKSGFVLAGLPVAREVFSVYDCTVAFRALKDEGSDVRKSDVIAEISGPTRSLLVCERVALNILQRLSGIATLTSRFVKKTEGLRARILDTRKTTPGMRYLEKYSVQTGGGQSHRMGLYDGILIKDNHIRAAGGVKEAVKLARKGSHLLKIEVEAGTLEEVREALEAGADVIMLDNMPVPDMKRAVRLARGKAILEASGNVTLRNVRDIAATGVDLISIGTLTHSAPAVDISMKLIEA
jgi:nicotinate-nucleotide pyrophosphorylase (carboxylating)